MVNKEYYLKVMKRLRESVRRKRPDLRLRKNGFILTMLWRIPPSDSLFSYKTWDIPHPSASKLTRPCTSGLLFLHQAEIRTERMTIWVHQGD